MTYQNGIIVLKKYSLIFSSLCKEKYRTEILPQFTTDAYSAFWTIDILTRSHAASGYEELIC